VFFPLLQFKDSVNLTQINSKLTGMKFFPFLLLVPFISLSQTGSISVNAYWKYNDYVGNRADAGSKVLIFSSDTAQGPLEGICDMQGNFKQENLTPGWYLVAVVSKNTTAQADHHYAELSQLFVKDYLPVDFEKIDKVLFDSIAVYQEKYKAAYSGKKITMWNANKALKSMEKEKKVLINAMVRLIKKVPITARTLYLIAGIMDVTMKYSIQQIQVKAGQNTAAIFDFGITYL
jgi:hypothetical protein